jgi:retinol dehydrogenase-12
LPAALKPLRSAINHPGLVPMFAGSRGSVRAWTLMTRRLASAVAKSRRASCVITTRPHAIAPPHTIPSGSHSRAYAAQIGDLDQKTFLVTGANTGIGRETVLALAGRGARVFVTGRSEQKTRPTIDEIVALAGTRAVEFLQLDLGDLNSVRACAGEFLRAGEPLHVLVNNAGLAGGRGMTDSGFELAFGTNYVGPFLLTALLLDRLRESAPARIVDVASVGHYRAPGIDYNAVRRRTKSLTGFPEYCVSKLGNVLHAQELAARLDGTGVTTYSLHPGSVASDVWRRVPWPLRPLITRNMDSPAEGARTSLYCATSPDVAADSGHYYDDCRRQEPSGVATPELASELWERSIDWVGLPR